MGGGLILFFVLILIIVIVGVVIGDNKRKEQARILEQRYRSALSILRDKPSDRAAYDRALAAGRAYVQIASETRGAIVFTETTLQSDLDAVTRQS